MNWKNISLEENFVKQEIALNGNKVVNYIPIDQVDSFGVRSTENKRWLYAGAFFLFCALTVAISADFKSSLFFWLGGIGAVAVYFLTRQTFFSITSSQTKFSVQMRTTPEEIQAITVFVDKIKERIQTSDYNEFRKSA